MANEKEKKIALKDNISSLKEHMSSKVGKNLKLNMEGAGFACKLITNVKETSKKDMKKKKLSFMGRVAW